MRKLIYWAFCALPVAIVGMICGWISLDSIVIASAIAVGFMAGILYVYNVAFAFEGLAVLGFAMLFGGSTAYSARYELADPRISSRRFLVFAASLVAVCIACGLLSRHLFS